MSDHKDSRVFRINDAGIALIHDKDGKLVATCSEDEFLKLRHNLPRETADKIAQLFDKHRERSRL